MTPSELCDKPSLASLLQTLPLRRFIEFELRKKKKNETNQQPTLPRNLNFEIQFGRNRRDVFEFSSVRARLWSLVRVGGTVFELKKQFTELFNMRRVHTLLTLKIKLNVFKQVVDINSYFENVGKGYAERFLLLFSCKN
jgi:hypothetical protein